MHGSGTTEHVAAASASRLRRSSRSSPSARPARYRSPRCSSSVAVNVGENGEEHRHGHSLARDDHLGQVAKLRKPSSGGDRHGPVPARPDSPCAARSAHRSHRGWRATRPHGPPHRPTAGAYRAARHGCQQRADHAASPRIDRRGARRAPRPGRPAHAASSTAEAAARRHRCRRHCGRAQRAR